MTHVARLKDLGDVDWMREALCQSTPIVWWFPESNKANAYNHARQICKRCDVREECLEFALRTNERWWGMYGGKTPQERRVMIGMKPRRQLGGLG